MLGKASANADRMVVGLSGYLLLNLRQDLLLRHGSCAMLDMLHGRFCAWLVLSLLLPASFCLECNLDGGEYVEEYWLMFNIETCHACPLGRYRRQELACEISDGTKECPKCTPCPEGRSTKQKGATSAEACDVEWNVTSIMHWVSIWIVDAFLSSLVVVVPCCCIICCCCRAAGKDSAREVANAASASTTGTSGPSGASTRRNGSKSSVRPDQVNISVRHGSKGSVRSVRSVRANCDDVLPISLNGDTYGDAGDGSRQGSKTSQRVSSKARPAWPGPALSSLSSQAETSQPSQRASTNFLTVAARSSSSGRHGSKNSSRPIHDNSSPSAVQKSPRSRSHRSVRIIDPSEAQDEQEDPQRWAFPSPKEGPSAESPDKAGEAPSRGIISVQEVQEFN